MSTCHPYEPGFAACVGVETPRQWNPYGPTRPDEPTPALPAGDAALLPIVTAPGPDDELRLDRAAASVPEPSVVLLTVLALATLWRARRTSR